MKKFNLIILLLLLFVIIFEFILFISFRKSASTKDSKLYLEIASKLKSVGVGLPATKYFDKVLLEGNLSRKEKSNIHYNMAKIYFDEGKYDEALGHLYSAEIIFSKTELKGEIGELIMNCLERLGRTRAAEYALESRAGMKKEDHEKGEKIVAKIGEEQITLNEFSQYLDRIPEWLKNEKYNSKEGKEEFLKKYVAEILLQRKAEKEGLSKDEEVQKKLKDMEKEVLIQTLLEREIKNKINIDDETVKLYFKANKDKYKEPKSNKEADFEAVKERVKRDLYTEKMQLLFNEMINKMILSSDVKLFPEVIK